MFGGGSPEMPPPMDPREYNYPQNLEQPAAIEPAAQVGSQMEDVQKKRALLAQKAAAKSVLSSSTDTTSAAAKGGKVSLLGR